MSHRALAAMIVASLVGFANSIAACSYLDQHPPTVCITADATDGGKAPDAAFVTVQPPPSATRNPGF